ncbi:MAG: hypothetical protein ACD_72C00270G0002 [uncultured bacterium]|nr:MAG: hypothetical protein ACD_72C00270G0002 [uncultured bacterium]
MSGGLRVLLAKEEKQMRIGKIVLLVSVALFTKAYGEGVALFFGGGVVLLYLAVSYRLYCREVRLANELVRRK